MLRQTRSGSTPHLIHMSCPYGQRVQQGCSASMGACRTCMGRDPSRLGPLCGTKTAVMYWVATCLCNPGSDVKSIQTGAAGAARGNFCNSYDEALPTKSLDLCAGTKSAKSIPFSFRSSLSRRSWRVCRRSSRGCPSLHHQARQQPPALCQACSAVPCSFSTSDIGCTTLAQP